MVWRARGPVVFVGGPFSRRSVLPTPPPPRRPVLRRPNSNIRGMSGFWTRQVKHRAPPKYNTVPPSYGIRAPALFARRIQCPALLSLGKEPLYFFST